MHSLATIQQQTKETYKDITSDFEAFDKQVEFTDAVLTFKYNFLLYGGAIKGGKTIIGLAILILLCRFFPRSRWAIVRSTMPEIVRNVFPNLDKILPESFVKKDRRFSPLFPHIEFLNGSKIIFFPENYVKDKELNRWKGLDVNGFLLEEMNELQEIVFWKAIERAGTYIIPNTKKQPIPLIVATCNPSQGYVKRLIYTPWENGTLSDEWFYLPANVFDNPYLTKEFIKGLNKLPKYQYKVFVQGDWNIQVKTGGEFLSGFELDIHLKVLKFDPAKTLHVSLDENVHPYISLTLWQIEEKTEKQPITKIKQIAEIIGEPPNNKIIKTAKMLIRYLEKNGFEDMVFIYGDRTSLKEDTKTEKGQNFFEILRNEIEMDFKTRIRLPSVNPSVALSGAFINEILESNFDNLEIQINESCYFSINDYIETKESADGGVLKQRVKDPITGISYEKNGHLTDTLRYFICEAFGESFQRFTTKNKEYIRIMKNYRG